MQQILQTWNLDRPATDQKWTLPEGRPEVPPSHQQDTTNNIPKNLKTGEKLKWTYGSLTDQKAAQWLQSLCADENNVRPTEEQIKFLRAVIQRCLAESQEEVTDTVPQRAMENYFSWRARSRKNTDFKVATAVFRNYLRLDASARICVSGPPEHPSGLDCRYDLAFLRKHSHQREACQQSHNARARTVRAVPTTSLDGAG